MVFIMNTDNFTAKAHLCISDVRENLSWMFFVLCYPACSIDPVRALAECGTDRCVVHINTRQLYCIVSKIHIQISTMLFWNKSVFFFAHVYHSITACWCHHDHSRQPAGVSGAPQSDGFLSLPVMETILEPGCAAVRWDVARRPVPQLFLCPSCQRRTELRQSDGRAQ